MSDLPSLESLLDVWKFTSGEHKNLWAYFITVTTAVVGFSFSEKFPKLSAPAKGALLAAFAIFLVSNVVSLGINVNIYNAVVRELTMHKAQLGSIVNALTETPLWLLVGLHLVLDATAVLIVWHRGFR